MEEQEILNKAVRHIRDQGGPSLNGTSCAYRGAQGRQCIAAPFMSYSRSMEGLGVARNHNHVLPAYKDRIDFLSAMQKALHDSVAFHGCSDEQFMAGFEESLVRFCRQWGLTAP